MSAIAKVSHIAGNVEALDKAAKITHRSIELYLIVNGVISKTLSSLVFHLKETCAMIEATRFVGAFKTLIIPNKQRVYFLKDPKNSWQICAQRVTLAGGSFLKTLKGAAKFGFLSLGKIGKYAIGHLTLFHLFGDGLILCSNFFSAWESNNKRGSIVKKIEVAQYKIQKWIDLPSLIATVRVGSQNEITVLNNKYNVKLAKVKQEIADLELRSRLCQDMLDKVNPQSSSFDTSLGDATRNHIKEKYTKEAQQVSKHLNHSISLQTKYAGRISKIANGNFNALADELQAKNRLEKIRKWEHVRDIAQGDMTLSWIKIGAAVSKVFVIAFALGLTFMNFWTPIVTIPLLSLGILSDSLGLMKVFYEQSLESARKKPLHTPIEKPLQAHIEKSLPIQPEKPLSVAVG